MSVLQLGSKMRVIDFAPATDDVRFDAKCFECRMGEHADFDDDIKLVEIRYADEPTGKFVKRAKMCAEHRDMFADDGYDVRLVR